MLEAVNKARYNAGMAAIVGANTNAVDNGESGVKEDYTATPPAKRELKEKPQDSAQAASGNSKFDIVDRVGTVDLSGKGGGLPKSASRQRGIYAAKKLADKSKELNVTELMDSLALEWSEKKATIGEEPPPKGSPNAESKKKVSSKNESNGDSVKNAEDDVKSATLVIPSVDYSDDESDSDDDLNLEQFVKSTASKATPTKKAPLAPTPAKLKIVELETPPPSEKSVKQPPSEKELAKALSKKEKKKAAAAAKKERKKAAAAAAAADITCASHQNIPKDNIATNKQKKVVPPAAVDKAAPTKESGPPQNNQKRPPPGIVGKSPVPMYQQNGASLSESQIAQAMNSSAIDYGDRVNDTALPQSPTGRKSPNVELDQSSDLFIMQDSSSSTSQVPPPHPVQSPIMSNFSPIRSASASQPISPSFLTRLSSLTADHEVLTAKTNFLESENQSLRAEVEALRNQMAIDRQSAVEALQRVQLKSYISETAKDVAEERAAWLEAVLADAVAEMTTREVVRIETNEAIKSVSYAAVQAPAAPSSYHTQQMQSSSSSQHRPSVLPPLDEGDPQTSAGSSLTSLRSASDGVHSFSFEGDLSLGQSGGILPQAPWARDEGVFARLRRGDEA